jgi:hypothetical protein
LKDSFLKITGKEETNNSSHNITNINIFISKYQAMKDKNKKNTYKTKVTYLK